jgi:hypothetical protein
LYCSLLVDLQYNPVPACAREIKRRAALAWWETASSRLSAQYRRWELSYAVKPLPELELPRSTLHRLLAVRTGHGDFSWYHTKFNHDDATLECSCGMPKTPDHLVHCKKIFRYLHNWPFKPKRPPRNSTEGWRYIKRLTEKPQRFAEFLQLTNFYTKVCTR